MKKILVLLFVLLMLLTACETVEEQQVYDNTFYEEYSGYNVIGDGIYIVKKGEKFGIADSETGEVYADFVYDKMTKVSNEKILAAKNGEYSIISPDGTTLCELGSYGNVRPYYNGDIPRFLTYNDGWYTLLDENGELICDYGEFDHLELNTKTYDSFVIQRGTLYTVINESGNQIAYLGRFDEVVPEFDNDAFIVTKNAKKGILNQKGAAVVSIKYDDIWKMQKNTSYVLVSGDKFGVANKSGKQIMPIEYDGIEGYSNIIIAVKDGNYGLYDIDGKELVPCEYEKPYDVREEDDTFKCLVSKDQKVYEAVLNEDGFSISEL